MELIPDDLGKPVSVADLCEDRNGFVDLSRRLDRIPTPPVEVERDMEICMFGFGVAAGVVRGPNILPNIEGAAVLL